jgi:ubiquinone/menaquinone biosynthesis C-methylase UbiE
VADQGSEEATRRYYDEFAANYDRQRGGRVPGGYHDLVDDLEVEFVTRYADGKELLEVGCGTGLLLERFAARTRRARGVDLSPMMLERARARGLDVSEASATELPFPDASFDVTCSFKVLPHVRDIGRALDEMARVTRPGGTVIAEFYNPYSLRGLAKRLGPAGAISTTTNEDAVYTRFDSKSDVARLLPRCLRMVGERGVRIVIPSAGALRVPLLGPVLATLERRLCDGPFAALAGFWIVALERS